MQERYLGDSHDFMKYALLRTLNTKLDLTLGINWYLTDPHKVDPIGNSDGEKRHHLKGGVWKIWDADLFKKIKALQEPENRILENVAKYKILPTSSVYYDHEVSPNNRGQWHETGMSHLKEQGLVFLDPDNGFQVKSMTRKRAPKYSLYSEAVDYYERGQSVFAIQFARQCDPVERAKNTVTIIRENLKQACAINVLRGRLAPNLLFIMLSELSLSDKVEDVFTTFCQRSGGKAEVVKI